MARVAILDLEISCWRQNCYAFNSLAQILAKMVNVSGEEIIRSSLNCGQQDIRIFFRQRNSCGQSALASFTKLQLLRQLKKSGWLRLVRQVDSRLLQGIARGPYLYISKYSQFAKKRIRSIRCRENHVRVQQQPIHLLRPYMTNGIRIEAEFSDFLPFACISGDYFASASRTASYAGFF